ncbi:MAG: inorganic diphosphatase [Myxococcales bacterium]|nr:inorganic diphosphatase [Myxococcales bacterium]
MIELELPAVVDVVVEVPKGGFVKRGDDGQPEFLSPLPCPFNYGSVPGHPSGDGDLLDAVLLGPRVPQGHRARTTAWGVVRFVDAGDDDPKLICSATRPTRGQRLTVRAFFTVYARAKALANRLRGRPGATRLVALELPP